MIWNSWVVVYQLTEIYHRRNDLSAIETFIGFRKRNSKHDHPSEAKGPWYLSCTSQKLFGTVEYINLLRELHTIIGFSKKLLYLFQRVPRSNRQAHQLVEMLLKGTDWHFGASPQEGILGPPVLLTSTSEPFSLRKKKTFFFMMMRTIRSWFAKRKLFNLLQTINEIQQDCY